MSRNELLIFKKPTDAVGSNRGFIYQYLKTLVLWLKNYKENRNVKIYCEVEDDIKEKEINSTLKRVHYTQLKCYTSVLSLEHKDVQKSLYNFFILFLANEDYEGTFSFETNTAISSRDKLLASWALEEGRLELDQELLDKCISKTQEILLNQFEAEKNSYKSNLQKQIKNKENKITHETNSKKIEQYTQEKNELANKLNNYEQKAEIICAEIANKETIKKFVNRIQWKFANIRAEDSMKVLEQEALDILHDILGTNKNHYIYFCRLLTEVSKKAVHNEEENRILDNELLRDILTETDDEINAQISEELVNKFQESLRAGLEGVHEHLDKIGEKIDQITSIGLPKKYLEEYSLVELPHQEPEIIDDFISRENNDHQSKLETKILKMENVDEDMKESLLEMGTEFRCRYLIHLEELRLNSTKAYNAVKILEKKVQKLCTRYTRGLSKRVQVDSSEFYDELEDKLELLLENFNDEIIKNGLKVDIDIVTGQMFHMAAKCSLRWHKEEQVI
ncbi:hypothetical protein [Ureibacillus thermosphaericus]|uniref:hypothetical protein n=1 Tax=Ureibacillus thermosphaericus TaxID=51173 RepID=UPI0030C9569B